MKIVFIITDYGSFNNFLGELAKEMVTHHHDVHVICHNDKTIDYPDKYNYKYLGIHFYFLDFSRSFRVFSWLRTSFKIKKIIADIDPDLVNLHFTTAMFITFLSGKIKYHTLGVFHGIGFPVIASPIKKFVFKSVEFFCCRKLDKVLLINQMDYEIVKKYFSQKALKYHTFGVGCDLIKFDPEKFSENDKFQLREKLNIQQQDFVLMYTGRFTFFKGFGLVVKAFKYIEEKGLIKNIKLILVGGKDEIHSTGLNNEEEKYLTNAKNIIKTGFTSEVDRYLSVSDLFVFPSNKEGMPVSIMESIAMGVPVVTFDSRGCNDIIHENFNGKLIDIQSDHITIAKAIVALYSTPGQLREFSANALAQRVDFDRNLFIDESIRIFENEIKDRFQFATYLSSEEMIIKSPEDAGN